MPKNTPEEGTVQSPICVIGEIGLRLEPSPLEKMLNRSTSIMLTMPLLGGEETYLRDIMHFEHCGHALRHGFQKAKSFKPPEEVSAEKFVNFATILKVTDG